MFFLQTCTPPNPNIFPLISFRNPKAVPSCFALSKNHDSEPDLKPSTSTPKPQSKSRTRRQLKTQVPKNDTDDPNKNFPTTIPRKPRRGRRSEAAAVEDFVRDSLERTFASMKEQNSQAFDDVEKIMKDRVEDDRESDISDEEEEDDVDEESGVGDVMKKKMVVEEESQSWPLDADVGWGVRASEYFEKHPIKNIVGEDGVEIDWEGEVDDSWVKEINCLEWETFAFHPSPLVVLVFERYNRATDNWKALKELEKALQVYWDAKDRLPPRAVKIDINIEKDLAYALKVKEGPQILFVRGNRILYKEKASRTAEELVQMIAHFYYKAKRPSWIDARAICSPY